MFTQPEERLAVLFFRQWQRRQHSRTVNVPFVPSDFQDLEPIQQAEWTMNSDADGMAKLSYGFTVPEVAVWTWVKQQIIDRPKYVADMTGIEQTAYVSGLAKPTPSPTLDEVGELYFSKSGVEKHWLAKSRHFWGEFCDSVDVKTLRELTQEHIAIYKTDVLESPPSPTYVKHRFWSGQDDHQLLATVGQMG